MDVEQPCPQGTISRTRVGQAHLPIKAILSVVFVGGFAIVDSRIGTVGAQTPEQQCYDLVEGRVAWNREGDTNWNSSNIETLCRGTTNPDATIACFEAGIAAHGEWQRALDNCVASAGTAAMPATEPSDKWAGKTWHGYSSISIYVTGDITTNPNEIIFGNGARMPVRVVEDEALGEWGFGDETGYATIFEIWPPSNPLLLEGTPLCGWQPKYISVFVDPQGGMVFSVYGGPDVPRNNRGDDVCGIYDFGPA